MPDITSWNSVLKNLQPPLDDQQIKWLDNQEPVFIHQFTFYYSISGSYDRAIHRAIEETLSILIPETICRIGECMKDDEKTINEKHEYLALVLDPKVIWPSPY